MALSYVSTNANALPNYATLSGGSWSGQAGGVVFNTPPSVGDLAIIACGDIGAGNTPLAPSGWTAVLSASQLQAAGGAQVWWKVWQSSDSSGPNNGYDIVNGTQTTVANSVAFQSNGASAGQTCWCGNAYAGLGPRVDSVALMSNQGAGMFSGTVITNTASDWAALVYTGGYADGTATGSLNTTPPLTGRQGGTYDTGSDTSVVGLLDSNAPVTQGTYNQSASYEAMGAGLLLSLADANTPAAPTLLSPANGAYADLTTPTFVWGYNNTDGSSQGAWAFRQKISGASSYNYWSVAAAAWQSTIVWNPGSATSYTFPSGAFANGNVYNWSVACESSYDTSLQGPFATDNTVTGQAAPTVTVTGPTGTETTATPSIAATATTASGATVISWRALVYTTAQVTATGFAWGQSGAAWDSTITAGTLPASITIGTALTNNTAYTAGVMVNETGNEPSTWAQSPSFTVVYDEPAAPTVTAAPSADGRDTPCIAVTVQGNDNLLSEADASFETGVGTWTAAANCTVAQSSAEALDGSYSLALTSTAAGLMGAITGAYTVQPGSEYTALMSFRAAATAENTVVQLSFYDNTGAHISDFDATPAADTTTGWTKSTVTATAPSNAATAKLWAYVQNTAAASEVHYVDCAGLFNRANTTWSRGGLSGTTAVTLTRSDGQYVRNASATNQTALPTPGQTAVIYDYEVTPGTAYTYTGYVTSGSGATAIASPQATSGNATLTTVKWVEIDPTSPSTAVQAQATAWNSQTTQQAAAHLVMGLATPIVVSSVMGGTDGNATFETFDTPTYDALEALCTSGQVIFVSSPFGKSYYVIFGPQTGAMTSGNGMKVHDSQLLPGSTTLNQHSTVAVTFVAQPRPPV